MIWTHYALENLTQTFWDLIQILAPWKICALETLFQSSMSYWPAHQSSNTTTSTTSSTIPHLISWMIVTTTYSTINSTIPTHTLRHQPTAATLATSTTSLSPNTSYNASPSPIHTHPRSTYTAKCKSTSTSQIHIHIAKLCSIIQHKPESSIIQIIEKHFSKQNKHKKAATTKNFIISNQGFNP